VLGTAAESVFIGGTTGLNTQRSLNVVKEGSSAGLTLTAYQGSGNARAKIDFSKANGTIDAPAILADGNELAQFEFYGYDGNSFDLGASLEVQVDGVPSDGNVPMKFSFQIQGNEKLAIGSDGDVVVENGGLLIASGDLDMVGNLASTGTARFGDLGDPAGGDQGDAYVIADDNGNLSRGAAVPPNMPLISQLQKENKELRDRLERLEAIVEELTK
jgi:hypothetical protein